MSTSKKQRYHHGDLRPALIAAATTLVEENGVGAVSLREAARRVGVSAPAIYRHFANKDSLLAAVAAEGFRDLGAALAAASRSERDPLSAMGMAYVRFALSRRGVFRLMFGPELAKRANFPELKSAADQAFQWLKGGAQARGRAAQRFTLGCHRALGAGARLGAVVPRWGLAGNPGRNHHRGDHEAAAPCRQ